jgi:Putative zinc- or iron-chelating domain
MRHFDTIEKVVGVYLAGVCDESFEYQGRRYEPKPLIVSPLLLRGHTCPSACGACCGNFSLDYLPGEIASKESSTRRISISARTVDVLSDRQHDVPDRWCRNLERQTGRCSIYGHRPMACDFELIRFLIYKDRVILIQKLYGRAWAMQRLDGVVGARCEMLPKDPEKVSAVIRKLRRLEDWANHFGIATRIESIIRWIEMDDCELPLRLDPKSVASPSTRV